MEAALLVASICAVVMLALRLYRSERPKGEPGLGLFAYKESLDTTRPQSGTEKRNA